MFYVEFSNSACIGELGEFESAFPKAKRISFDTYEVSDHDEWRRIVEIVRDEELDVTLFDEDDEIDPDAPFPDEDQRYGPVPVVTPVAINVYYADGAPMNHPHQSSPDGGFWLDQHGELTPNRDEARIFDGWSAASEEIPGIDELADGWLESLMLVLM